MEILNLIINKPDTIVGERKIMQLKFLNLHAPCPRAMFTLPLLLWILGSGFWAGAESGLACCGSPQDLESLVHRSVMLMWIDVFGLFFTDFVIILHLSSSLLS